MIILLSKTINKCLKVGVFGAGHLGKIHLRLAESSNKLELIRFYDPYPDAVETIISENKYNFYDSAEYLIQAIDISRLCHS